MKKYPFFAVAFNSDVERHYMPTSEGVKYVDFVLDLASMRFPKNPCVVDYDHDTKEPIGFATLGVENGQVVARGEFVSAFDNDRAFSIGETFPDVPYGISPTLDLDDAEYVEAKEGETVEANDRTYNGPVLIYKNAAVLGISVCPLPTDCETSVEPLKANGVVTLNRLGVVIMNDELQNVEEPIPVDEETVEQLGDETGTQDGPMQVRDPELQEFIDEFGLEKGVAFFQRGLTLDEARMEDYKELKRLSKLNCDDEKKEELDAEGTSDEEKKEDDPESVATLARDLKKSLSIFNGIVAKLSRDAGRVGSQYSPRHNYAFRNQKRTFADSVSDALKR